MTNQIEALIADANQAATIMEYLASFEPQDIEGDDVELRFEFDGVDAGTDVSLVEQCGKTSGIIKALIAALEQSEKQRESWKQLAQTNISERENDIAELDAARKRIAELEASKLAVKLPKGKLMQSVYNTDHADVDAWVLCISVDSAAEAIHAAGGTVQGEE